MQFSNEDLKNIAALISNSPIKGGESLVVALLLQKIGSLLTPEVKKETEKND